MITVIVEGWNLRFETDRDTLPTLLDWIHRTCGGSGGMLRVRILP